MRVVTLLNPLLAYTYKHYATFVPIEHILVTIHPHKHYLKFVPIEHILTHL